MKAHRNYFSHDYNSRSDEKIVKLLKKHGLEGYGAFWGIVECLYNNDNMMALDYDSIAYELHTTDNEIIESIINDFGLFITKDGTFGSATIEKRLAEMKEVSQRQRDRVLKRWRKDTTVSENDTTVTKKDTINKYINKEIKKEEKKSSFNPRNPEGLKMP